MSRCANLDSCLRHFLREPVVGVVLREPLLLQPLIDGGDGAEKLRFLMTQEGQKLLRLISALNAVHSVAWKTRPSFSIHHQAFRLRIRSPQNRQNLETLGIEIAPVDDAFRSKKRRSPQATDRVALPLQSNGPRRERQREEIRAILRDEDRMSRKLSEVVQVFQADRELAKPPTWQ